MATSASRRPAPNASLEAEAAAHLVHAALHRVGRFLVRRRAVALLGGVVARRRGLRLASLREARFLGREELELLRVPADLLAGVLHELDPVALEAILAGADRGADLA